MDKARGSANNRARVSSSRRNLRWEADEQTAGYPSASGLRDGDCHQYVGARPVQPGPALTLPNIY